MAGEWRDTTIGAEVTLQRGIDITKATQRAGTIPVISSGGVSSYHDAPAANGPGVILGRKGVVGSVYYVASDYWPHDTTLWVKDFHGNEPRFVYYFFRWLAPRLAAMDVGSANPTLNRNHVHPIKIRWPSQADEQRAIAHILGALDDKIELNRRMNATLEAMARALFKSWFVDFDPVRDKIQRRDAKTQRRDDEALAALRPGGFALSPALADLFPDGFEASAVGEVPRGWRVGSLDDFAALNPESWSKTTHPAFIRYVDLTNTKWGRIETITEYAAQDAPSRAQRVLKPGDTIVGTVRPGNGSYAYVTEDGLTGSTGFAVLRSTRLQYREFVYLSATMRDNIETLAHLADGGAYPAVRPEIVVSTQVVCPTDVILLEFSKITSPSLAKMALNERESRTLAALRDALLPKLISGAVRVGAAERFLEAAL